MYYLLIIFASHISSPIEFSSLETCQQARHIVMDKYRESGHGKSDVEKFIVCVKK